ncbi:MAG TPA: MFS transporter [Amoebophilaceae bacterium]|nr:MFS transporter [Amoebophilaceae bacterium]
MHVETFSSLSNEKKEAIGILSIGTFLEYFDLLLYVHMAVLLNELFFPKTDPHTAALLAAFAFCSSYVLRPLGALIFGYIGDNIGRKSTVIVTATMMSLSCFTMANLPTYEQIGITAAYIVTICRVAQGMATMGEVICADLYITELTKPPIQYPAVTLIAVFGVLGGTVALGVASLVTSFGLNWRSAFWLGTLVAVIGAVARTRLRETPDFADTKRRIKNAIIKAKHDPDLLNHNVIWNQKVNKKTALSLFFIECSWPVCFYFAYMYCGNILKNTFYLTPAEIIHQNFIVSMIQLFSWLMVGYLSYIVYPLKILKVRLILFLIFIALCPHLLNNSTSPHQIMAIQAFIAVFGFMGTPAIPIFYKHFPIFRRFTYATFSYALSRAFVYVVTSFGLVYLHTFFGNYVVLVVMIPTAIAFIYALHHFETLEKANGHHAY